jgi:hypothetical protein
MRAASKLLSLLGAFRFVKAGRSYGNLAAQMDERRAEDEFDAAMGTCQPVTSNRQLRKLTQQHPSAAA